MSEENKVENTTVENAVVEAAEGKKESKVKGFVSKVGAGVKKHGGKVLGVLAVGAIGVAAYAIGKRSGNMDSESADYDEDDDDVVDVEYSEEDAE